MDFTNLNQAAHGDRQGLVLSTCALPRSNRKGVVGHSVSFPEVVEPYLLGLTGAPRGPGTTCKARNLPASATTCA